nr:hypothetical protein [Streptomyces buecherae]
MQPLGAGAGADPQFLGEAGSEAVEDTHRVSSSATVVQRRHQLDVEALVQGMVVHEVRQIVHDLVVLAEFEPPLGVLLQRAEPLLVQARGGSGQDRRAQPVECGPTPQAQRRPDQLDRPLESPPGGVAAALGHPGGEAERVEPGGVEADAVAGLLGEDEPPVGVAQAFPQRRDGVPQLLGGGGGRLVIPGHLDEPGQRHHRVGRQQQCCQQPLATRPGHRHPLTACPDVQRTENAKVHPSGLPPCHQ